MDIFCISCSQTERNILRAPLELIKGDTDISLIRYFVREVGVKMVQRLQKVSDLSFLFVKQIFS